MKILSNEETKAWVSHKVTREALQSEYSYRVAYLLPGDAGKKTALAKGLVNAIDPAPMGLLWITQFGVWPSSENMDLFTGYRTSLGEHRSLRDAPGHLFDKSELVSLQSLLSLALYFSWDTFLFDGAKKLVIQISHDEYVNVYGKDQARFDNVEELLTKMELKQINHNGKEGTA